jgi:hypothetical protein
VFDDGAVGRGISLSFSRETMAGPALNLQAGRTGTGEFPHLEQPQPRWFGGFHLIGFGRSI